LLVVGEPAEVCAVLTEVGADAWVLPAGAGRVAVVPREDEYSYAHVDRLAASVTRRTGVHEYISDQEVLVDWFIDDDGESRFRIGDVEYPATAPTPSGPVGADQDVLAPFGIGVIDQARLGAVLRRELRDQEEDLFAERHHRSILEAMNLDPAGLTTAFRWIGPGDLPTRYACGPLGSARDGERTSTTITTHLTPPG
jgi:hypothetical protein